MFKVRISKTMPRGVTVDYYSSVLEPSGRILWGYKDGTVSKEQYTKEYLENLERNKTTILREIDSIKVLAARSGKKDIVLLCWCAKGAFCHRRLFARWYEEKTGEKIEEL